MATYQELYDRFVSAAGEVNDARMRMDAAEQRWRQSQDILVEALGNREVCVTFKKPNNEIGIRIIRAQKNTCCATDVESGLKPSGKP